MWDSYTCKDYIMYGYKAYDNVHYVPCKRKKHIQRTIWTNSTS